MHSGKPTLKEANDMGKKELSEFKGRVMKAKGYKSTMRIRMRSNTRSQKSKESR